MKISNYVQVALTGLSALVLPTFYQNGAIPKIETELISDGQKVKSDYVKSVQEIRKVAKNFEHQK